MIRPAVSINTHRKVLLFVAGSGPNSLAAVSNFERLCRSSPGFDFDLEIVDVLEQHPRALERRVLVTPCLVLVHPVPEVMIVGSLTDLERVRRALRLPPPDGSGHA